MQYNFMFIFKKYDRVRFKVILAMDKWSHIYISNIEILSILQITGKCNVFRGGSRGGGSRGGRPPPKIGKNMICWRNIVIFHTKYPRNPGSAPGI
jgi:hypothetical protein